MRHTIATAFFIVAAPASVVAQGARTAPPRPPLPAAAAGVRLGPDGAEGVRLGIAVSAGSAGDTLGLLVTSVEANGPAAKAGIENGARLQAINGVNLRLSQEDASDVSSRWLGANRLRRELTKVKAGDVVTLDVVVGGRARTVKVTTPAPGEMVERRAVRVRAGTAAARSPAALGLVLAATGTSRDTIGIFVQEVVAGGPAEKAGIIEGDRIAGINGVNVRVAREDAGDPVAASARVDRMQRELAKVEAGGAVDLAVVSGGRTRNVKVTTVAARDLPGYGVGDPFAWGFAAPSAATMAFDSAFAVHVRPELEELRGALRRDLQPSLDSIRMRAMELQRSLAPSLDSARTRAEQARRAIEPYLDSMRAQMRALQPQMPPRLRRIVRF
ncbi:MAG: PDZ domain-containing protein [Gemmatimonadaceae bacterium]|nr:PDZ domain-containing protein [Gemmatimonadaceae bacterium]